MRHSTTDSPMSSSNSFYINSKDTYSNFVLSKTIACYAIKVSCFSNGRVAEWLKAADCKSALFGVRWFESILSHQIYWGVAKR